MFSEPGRVERLLGLTATALRDLRTEDDAAALSMTLAKKWRLGFGPKERAFMLAAAIKAAEPIDAVMLHRFLSDALAEDEPEDELGAEAQTRRWQEYCRNKRRA